MTPLDGCDDSLLVYADWLEDEGDSAAALAVRGSVEDGGVNDWCYESCGSGVGSVGVGSGGVVGSVGVVGVVGVVGSGGVVGGVGVVVGVVGVSGGGIGGGIGGGSNRMR